MCMETPKDPTSIDNRISEGLSRIAIAMRSDEWSKAEKAGLKPTQLAILEFLAGRNGARVKEIAAHLGVSQPTATDLDCGTGAQGARRQGERSRRQARHRDPHHGRGNGSARLRFADRNGGDGGRPFALRERTGEPAAVTRQDDPASAGGKRHTDPADVHELSLLPPLPAFWCCQTAPLQFRERGLRQE